MVVTVPAYFNDAQRQATKDAGTLIFLSSQGVQPLEAATRISPHASACTCRYYRGAECPQNSQRAYCGSHSVWCAPGRASKPLDRLCTPPPAPNHHAAPLRPRSGWRHSDYSRL